VNSLYPESEDGTIDPKKAISIAESLKSRQFWSYLVEQKKISPEEFIKSIPHLSFVWGEKM
jgi:malate dehydrogenase (quinone)